MYIYICLIDFIAQYLCNIVNFQKRLVNTFICKVTGLNLQQVVIFTIIPFCCVFCCFNQALSMNGNTREEGDGNPSGRMRHGGLTYSAGEQVSHSNVQQNRYVSVETQTSMCDGLEGTGDRIYLSSESKDICYGMMLGSMFCTAGGCGAGLVGSVAAHGFSVSPMAVSVATGGNLGCLCGFFSGPFWLPKCRECTQKLQEARASSTAQSGGYELIEVHSSGQGHSTPSSPITSQPRGSGRPPSIYQVTETVTSLLLPGYDHKSQVWMLQGMQGILLGTSEQVLSTLKLLALRAHEPLPSTKDSFLQLNMQPFVRKNTFQSMCRVTSKKNIVEPYRLFGSINSYHTNLEHKVQSAQSGVIYDIMSGVTIGLAYNHYNQDVKKIYRGEIGIVGESIKTKTKADTFSSIVVFNTNKKGFTGHLASFLGWGDVKSFRSRKMIEEQVTYKGMPKIYLMGGLAQLGYNLPLSRRFCITPYVECIISVVRWSPYKETSGTTSCEFSSNKEKVWERSIGLQNHWNPTDTSSLQVWIAGVLREQNIHSLVSTLVSPLSHYEVSVPGYRKQYRKVELGLSHTIKMAENFSMGLNGKTAFEKEKKFVYSTMGLQCSYVY